MTNAFNWKKDPRPSVFAADARFVANKHGKSVSQTASESQQEYEAKNGKSRGTVYGISKKSDEAAEEFTRRTQVKAGKSRAPGHYR